MGQRDEASESDLDELVIDELEHGADVVFGLTPDLELGYLNPAWVQLAEENGGTDIPQR